MVADADIQVWLEFFNRTRPSIIVPYIQSNESRTLRYQVRTVTQGASGRSVVSQGGMVNLLPATPTPLGKLSVNADGADACSIDVAISEPGSKDLSYHFTCPD